MSRKTSLPSQETNGATVSSPRRVAKASASPTPLRQIHGAFTPIVGPITSVRQLIRSPNVAKGALGSFDSIEAYGSYLRGLSTADLHRHAIEEAHIVAIDDRDRLIRRLESEWSGQAIKETHGSLATSVPKRAPFTEKQIAAQEAIRRKLLGAR